MPSRATLLVVATLLLPLRVPYLPGKEVDDQIPESCLRCGEAGVGVPANDTLASANLPAHSWTVRKQVNEVAVFFTVTERHRFVQDLLPENVRVTDDHKQVSRITDFRPQQDLPLRLGLLIDTSGSVNPRFVFEQRAAVQFLQTIVRRGPDRVFVLGFSNHTTLAQDYSDDRELLSAGVNGLHNQGGSTALFEAVRIACDKLSVEPEDGQLSARVLILLSDGNDNASRITLQQALHAAEIGDVTIYTIDTTPANLDLQEFYATAAGKAAMKRLAEQSGGVFFSRLNPLGVGQAFKSIEQEMRNRYALFYHPNELIADGRFRRIEIAAHKPGKRLHVRARKGYYARLLVPTK